MEDLHAHTGAPQPMLAMPDLQPTPRRHRPALRVPQGVGGRRKRPRDTVASEAPSAAPHHVLLVDVDSPLREQLLTAFTAEGMLVTALASAEDLAAHVDRLDPHVVLLGLQPHGKAALDMCVRLREQGRHVPVILLSTRRDEIDCVLGLEGGADDYVVQPCSARELLARVRAVLRRSGSAPPVPAAQPEGELVVVGDSVFDPNQRSLSCGAELRHLNPIEYAILAELLLHPAQPISRQRLLEVSHGRGKAPLPRSIDTAVMRLRRLVEPQPSQPVYLQTLHGQGYMFLPTGRRGG